MYVVVRLRRTDATVKLQVTSSQVLLVVTHVMAKMRWTDARVKLIYEVLTNTIGDDMIVIACMLKCTALLC